MADHEAKAEIAKQLYLRCQKAGRVSFKIIRRVRGQRGAPSEYETVQSKVIDAINDQFRKGDDAEDKLTFTEANDAAA